MVHFMFLWWTCRLDVQILTSIAALLLSFVQHFGPDMSASAYSWSPKVYNNDDNDDEHICSSEDEPFTFINVTKVCLKERFARSETAPYSVLLFRRFYVGSTVMNKFCV